jgi:hypothetical protein
MFKPARTSKRRHLPPDDSIGGLADATAMSSSGGKFQL